MSLPSRRTIRTVFVAVLAVAGLMACEAAPTAAPGGARLNDAARQPSASVVDVHEATLRWLIAEKGATGMDAYCVSTGWPESNVDASQELLDRFAGSTPPVVPYSSCTIAVTGDTYNPTGGPAEWFFLGDPVISGRRAEIDAGFHINGRLAEFHHCNLRSQGTRWVVAGCVITGAA